MPLPLLGLWLFLVCSTGCQSGASAGHPTDSTLVVQSADSAVRAAVAALAEGRPWRATQLVAPALADSARRTPEAVLVAAVAASEWQGWAEVQRLLGDAPWLDSLFAARGRELLAQAALGRDDAALALAHAEAAVRRAPDDARVRGARLVLLARALDRLDQRDSARVSYERAAGVLPGVGDWLRLRAAGLTADAGARTAIYGSLRTAVARERRGWTEAQALERAGDLEGAATLYDSLHAPVSALRLRLATRRDPESRQALRAALLRIVTTRSGTEDARGAVALLDDHFAPLGAGEELLVARSAAASGPLGRAATGFARGLRDPGATSRDRYTYASVLARLNRDREAAAQYALVRAPRPLAARAAYERARALLGAGDRRGAQRLLRSIVATYADQPATTSALSLLADLATDDGRDTAARAAYLDAARRHPTSDRAAHASFQAAIIAYTMGDYRAAAEELDALARRSTDADYTSAARYWSGRAWDRLGEADRARERWQAVVAADSISYYGVVARRRLGRPSWAPASTPETFAAVPGLDSAVARARLLDRLDLRAELRHEQERLVRQAGDSVPRLLATAAALREIGASSRAIHVARRALELGAPHDARVYRLVYPVLFRDLITSEARARQADPALVAALIRQESAYNPRALSVAGARGLMQVMPSVGARVARSLDFPLWDPVLLYQPDVNVQLGMAHLATLVQQYGEVTRVLAAYNAGGSRVTRWSTKAGTDDPEVFAERIPFTETRDYVRIVQRNRELYRALYGW